jgi:hypothetical protein
LESRILFEKLTIEESDYWDGEKEVVENKKPAILNVH